MNNETSPRVGIGIMIFKEGKILLGKRQGSHEAGEYSFPGGHLEYMESYKDCALREIVEEAGIEIENLKFKYLASITQYAPKRYVHIGMTTDWKSGEPQVLEPEKCESWDWYDLDNLPEPMFYQCKTAVESHKTGSIFRDAE